MIQVEAGVVDADYRGPVKVVLLNYEKQDFEFKKGDYIAQFILETIDTQLAIQVRILEDTKQGDKAFGSIGDPWLLMILPFYGVNPSLRSTI